MLVLARKQGERIQISGPCEITVLSIEGRNVKVGIVADKAVKILRSEIADRERTEPDGTDDSRS